MIESHTHVDPDVLYYFFHSPGQKGFGASITGWTNPRFDAVVEEATTAGPGDRMRLLGDGQELIAAENPIVVLWYRDGEYAYRPADYDGWVSDPGHGIFTKRSFLPEYVEAARAERSGAVPAAAGTTRTGRGGTPRDRGRAAVRRRAVRRHLPELRAAPARPRQRRRLPVPPRSKLAR